jgi:hypothetical protein
MAITKEDLRDSPAVFDKDRLGEMTKADLRANTFTQNGIVTRKASVIDRTGPSSSSVSRSGLDVTASAVSRS